MDKILSGKTVAIDIKGQIKSYTEELKSSGKLGMMEAQYITKTSKKN